MKLSAALITFNEEHKLPECLRSLAFVDEIVIIDSFSTDRTAAVAQSFKARFEQKRLEDFSSQRNHAIGLCQGEWILMVDADERVTPALQEQILQAIRTTEVDGFTVTRINHILGGPLRHGASGKDAPLRLVRKSKGDFQGLVHEKWVVAGKVEALPGELTHITYQTMEEYFSKFNLFSTLDARELLARTGKRPSLVKILLRPLLEFLYYYGFRLGFLDGWRGFQYQILSSFYTFVRYAKAAHYFDHPAPPR